VAGARGPAREGRRLAPTSGMRREQRLGAAAGLFAACAAYGSFVPLVGRGIGWVEGLQRFSQMPFRPLEHLGTGDFFTNILVFLPIGFFGLGALGSRVFKGGTEVLPIVLMFLTASALFSAALEFGQVFIVARTPSWSDIFAQTLGALLGAIAWLALGERVITWASRPLRAETRGERLYQLLLVYAAGWLALSVLPLFFPRLAHPQLELWRTRMTISPLTLAGPIVLAGLGAVPLGALGAMSARIASNGHRTWHGSLAALVGPVLLIAVDRFRQVGFLPTDGHLAASLIGFAAGWLATGPPGAALRRRVAAPAGWRRPFVVTALLSLLVLHYWAPFNFGVRASALELRIRILYERAPFHRYYWTPPLLALGEAVTLLMLGGLLSCVLRSGRRGMTTAQATAVTALVFIAIEWGQLYLPARRADPTDVMIALVGAFMGAWVARALAVSPQPPRAGS
jgi:VanZ family protein